MDQQPSPAQRRFFGKEIEVTVAGEVKQPVAFRLEGKEYVVQEVLYSWHDYGFGGDPGRRHRWWQRHHRSYYCVRTTSNEVFEIYHDRGVSLKDSRSRKWYVTRQLQA